MQAQYNFNPSVNPNPRPFSSRGGGSARRMPARRSKATNSIPTISCHPATMSFQPVTMHTKKWPDAELTRSSWRIDQNLHYSNAEDTPRVGSQYVSNSQLNNAHLNSTQMSNSHMNRPESGRMNRPASGRLNKPDSNRIFMGNAHGVPGASVNDENTPPAFLNDSARGQRPKTAGYIRTPAQGSVTRGQHGMNQGITEMPGRPVRPQTAHARGGQISSRSTPSCSSSSNFYEKPNPGHTRYNKEHLKAANVGALELDGKRVFDYNQNRNTFFDKTTTRMIDLQLNNPHDCAPLYAEANFNETVGFHEDRFEAPNRRRRPKSASECIRNHQRRIGGAGGSDKMIPSITTNVYIPPQGGVQELDTDQFFADSSELQNANMTFSMPLEHHQSVAGGKHSSGQGPHATRAKDLIFGGSAIPNVGEKMKCRPKSAGSVMSGGKVPTKWLKQDPKPPPGPLTEYPPPNENKKPYFADYNAREVSKLTEAERKQYQEYWRKEARVPTVDEFPYRYCLGWSAFKPRRPPQFNYDPLKCEVNVFVTDKDTGSITKEVTDFVDPRLPASVESGEGANRRKGMAEYSDLTRLTHPRWNQIYHKALNEKERVFYSVAGPVSTFVDAMIKGGNKIH